VLTRNDLVFGSIGFCSENAKYSVAVPGSMIRPEVAEGKCRSRAWYPDGLLLARRQSRSGGEGGIPSKHPKKFSMPMVKRNFFAVNEQFVEKLFCQCC